MSIAEKLQTIAENEQRVYNAGYEKGKAEGGNVEEAYNEGFEAGKTQERSDFWDGLQDYGNRTVYSSTFNRWKDAMFKPKYDIRPTSFETGFASSSIKNLKQRLKDCGVVLDTSKCANMAQCFANSSITHIPTIDSTGAVGLTNTFSGAEMLVEIEKLILKANGTQTLNSTFYYASCLKDIVIEGTIGTNIQLQWSTKLTHDSLMSVINALKDYSTDTSGTTHTVQLGTENIEKLTADEQDIVAQKGWTLK